MKQITIDEFKITGQIKLGQLKTHHDLGVSEKKTVKALERTREALGKMQDTMYAHGKYAVLVCLQGMDTAGKDSLIREVFKDFNSRGVNVHSFKVPTELERNHDYIWRHYIALPPRGEFGIFNRTHYENVLVTRVHPEYILGEKIPSVHSIADVNTDFWNKRFEQINNFEKTIADNGTIIFKFFLNISKDEQRRRLLRRLEKQEKNWKFSPGDMVERQLWDQYQTCYEDAINRTSTAYAPWFVIPADDKATARYLVARILHDSLKGYSDIQEPELSDKLKANLELYKQQLESE